MKRKCQDVAITLGTLGISFTVTDLAASIIGLIPGLQAAIAVGKFFGVLATTCTISAVYFEICAKNGGMYLGYESSTNKIVYGLGAK